MVSFMDSERAYEIVDNYPIQKEVTIYYNSKNPKDSLLEPGNYPFSIYFISLFGFIFLLIGISFKENYSIGMKLKDAESCRRAGYSFSHRKSGITESIKYYKDGCTLNDKYACSALGKIYQRGKHGTKKDSNIANSFYKKACKLGNKDSCNISIILKYKEKCENDDAKSCKQLADIYVSRRRRNYKYKSSKLYKKACRLGYEDACGK